MEMDGNKTLEEFDEEKWVYDSSLDYKGRLPLRASTGAWKASLFILGIYVPYNPSSSHPANKQCFISYFIVFHVFINDVILYKQYSMC